MMESAALAPAEELGKMDTTKLEPLPGQSRPGGLAPYSLTFREEGGHLMHSYMTPGSKESWQEKRLVQTMNLRSVFTAEQQRILERYYDNGMTNQSKSCFQLILQCAQETKLDFSVVRTWVGNKRRKLASKVDQNGGVASHGTVGSCGGGVSAASGALLTPEMAGPHGAQRGTHLLMTAAPSPATTSSSSPSSCSSHGSGMGNGNGGNNDVIVTGIYSLARPPGLSRTEPSPQAKVDPPTPAHTRPPQQIDGASLHARPSTLPRRAPQPSGAGGPSIQVRKPLPAGDGVGVHRTWARQYTPPQPWPFLSHPQPAGSSSTPSPHAQPCTPDSGVRVQQVFSLATLSEGHHRGAPESGPLKAPSKTRPPDCSGCFSIAMETADADDEYAREEELASMGAQLQTCPAVGGSSGTGNYGPTAYPRMDSPGTPPTGRNPAAVKPLGSELFGAKGYQSQPMSSHCPPRLSFFLGSTGARGSYPVGIHQQGSPKSVSNLQVSGNLSAPWITSNSRKRTLQDRTQFSDRDVHTLKRYWDNGMTSLGSVCREKISAAAAELSVDSEIIKTWIGNRRRKYRLMGIEIPTPTSGPAVFTKQSSMESPRSMTPEDDDVSVPEPGEDSERNDVVSICLSEDGASDILQREDDDMDGEGTSALADNVKIEIIDDEDEEEDNDDEVIGPDVELVQNQLEFKQEEVRYLESELENQKQKYYKLQMFTKNLLSAVKNMDQEKQQELLASLPQEVEEDWELGSEPCADSVAASVSNSNSSVSEAVPLLAEVAL
ncbi:highly divergent homeobox isoform X1 [Brienomyrus brachyistius]|uniref:highly divergent homeobox isoform X1 n=1 Tax=Brienomyrus brachyistius TaxID=42636 RepID=UPI0020B376D8|nr:highly divergent homeobox isoform X1 [Brienomyrus brachyistius]XP_048885237.1 highly divergent homeobox isoform X1 [Brienomyrus brachyistius]